MADETYEDADELLGELESKVGFWTQVVHGRERDHWREVWAMVKRLNELLRAVRYPTPQGKTDARNRLQKAVEKARDGQKDYQEKLEEKQKRSTELLEQIEDLLNDARPPHVPWNPIGELAASAIEGLSRMAVDFILPGPSGDPFDDVRDDLKRRSDLLKRAWDIFKSHKDELLGRDRNKAYEQLREVQDALNEGWAKYKDVSAARAEAKKDAHLERLRARRDMLSEKLEKQENRLVDLDEKAATAWSDSFRDRVDEWRDDARRRIDDLRESLREVEAKIARIE